MVNYYIPRESMVVITYPCPNMVIEKISGMELGCDTAEVLFRNKISFDSTMNK